MAKKATRREAPAQSKTTKSRRPKKKRPQAESTKPTPFPSFNPGSLGTRLIGCPNGLSANTVVEEAVDRLIQRAVKGVRSLNRVNDMSSRLVAHAVRDRIPDTAIAWANAELNGTQFCKAVKKELRSDLFRRALRKIVGLRFGLPMDSEAQAEFKRDLDSLSPHAISLLQTATEVDDKPSGQESPATSSLAVPSVSEVISALVSSYRSERSTSRTARFVDGLKAPRAGADADPKKRLLDSIEKLPRDHNGRHATPESILR